jgi:hypothetical protein
MRQTTMRLAVGAGAFGGGLLLAACGAGSPHVIGPGASGPAGTASSALTAPSGGTSPSSTTPATTPPTTAPSAGLSQAVANQIDSDLNVLNNSLAQAESDLSNPNKGDQ